MRNLYTLLFVFIAFASKAQLTYDKFDEKASITIGSGISFYSVIDNNISYEKYLGILTSFNITLRNNITEKQFRDFYFALNTGTINNFDINARVNELTLGWDYGLKVNKKTNYDIFIGPAPFFYFYNRQQEMPSKLSVNSSLGIVSLATVFGIKSNKISGFNYKITSRIGLLSAGVSPKNEKITKLLTPFNGFQFHFSSLVSYKCLKWADIAAEYSFQTYNITAWNKMYSISDQLMLYLIFTF